MPQVTLNASLSRDKGSRSSRRLRQAGSIPAVVYGGGVDAVSIAVDAKAFRTAVSGDQGLNSLINLDADGQKYLVMAREIQRDHIHNTLIHIDFLAVSRTEKITVNVPVIEIGEAAGVKEGGVVEHHLREISAECFPQDVPEHIEIDISRVELGGMVHVSDLVAPQGVTILTNPEDALLSIITPAALRVEAALSVPGEEGVVPAEAAEEEVPAAEGEPGETPAAPEEDGEA